MDPLVRRVESSGVADHAEPAGACWTSRLRARRPSCRRADLDLDVLPGSHALDGLRACSWVGVQGSQPSTPGRASASPSSRRDVGDAELRRHLARLVERAADQRDDLDAADCPDRLEVLLAERAGPCEDDLHVAFSRMR